MTAAQRAFFVALTDDERETFRERMAICLADGIAEDEALRTAFADIERKRTRET